MAHSNLPKGMLHFIFFLFHLGNRHWVRGVSVRYDHGLHSRGNLQRRPRPSPGRGLGGDRLHRQLPSRPGHGRRHSSLQKIQDQSGQRGHTDCGFNFIFDWGTLKSANPGGIFLDFLS